MEWRKSSFSGGAENCLEVAHDVAWLVRDSKSPEPVLRVGHEPWSTFIEVIKA